MAYGREMAGGFAREAAQGQGLPSGGDSAAYAGGMADYDEDNAILDYEMEMRKRRQMAQALGQMAMLFAANRQPPAQKMTPVEKEKFSGTFMKRYSPMLERMQMEADAYKKFGAKDPSRQPAPAPAPQQTAQQPAPVAMMPMMNPGYALPMNMMPMPFTPQY